MSKAIKYLLAVMAICELLLACSFMWWRGEVRAAYSVPVTNAGGQPVPAAGGEQLVRVPYQSFSSNSGCVGLVGDCTFIFTPAPSGYRLVVENLSGWFELSGNAAAPPVVLLKDASLTTELGFTGALGQAFGTSIRAGINQPTRAYFDPADGSIFASVTGSFPAVSFPQHMTLTGYLENCSVTGCPKIQR